MPAFTKKPVTIEAYQYIRTEEASNADLLMKWAGGSIITIRSDRPECLMIATLEGDHIASPDDYIIKGIKGEFCPCKPDIFAATYDAAGASSGLPVKGYQSQGAENIALVNTNKELEERVLRQIELHMRRVGEKGPGALTVDGRWLSIAKTHIEQGFMALNRSVFQPKRVSLPEDGAASS